MRANYRFQILFLGYWPELLTSRPQAWVHQRRSTTANYRFRILVLVYQQKQYTEPLQQSRLGKRSLVAHTGCNHLGSTFANQQTFRVHRFGANQQVLGFHIFEATGATSGLPLPNSKSLDFIASGLLVLPQGHVCPRANH